MTAQPEENKPPRGYCIVINTDGSCNPRAKIGAYAYYIRGDSIKITNAGILRLRTKCINICELAAVGNAIAHLLKQPALPIVEKIIINTDSQVAIRRLTRGERPEKKPAFAAIMPRIFALLSELQQRTDAQYMEFRHVRAHANIDDAKTRANHWCDTHARKTLRAAVRERSRGKKAEK